MLKFPDQAETQHTTPLTQSVSEVILPATEQRATPAEIARALAEIEAKQMQAGDTVALGNVIEQLGIDVTPTELWEQIQRGRREAALEQQRNEESRRLAAETIRRRLIGTAAITTAVIVLLLSFVILNRQLQVAHTSAERLAKSSEITLDKLGPQQSAFVTLDDLNRLASGIPVQQIVGDIHLRKRIAGGRQWEVFCNERGQISVRAYGTYQATGRLIDVCSGKYNGRSQVSVPVSAFRGKSFADQTMDYISLQDDAQSGTVERVDLINQNTGTL